MVGPVTRSSSSSPYRTVSSSSPYRTAAGLASPVQTLHCDPLSENYLGASLLAQWQRIRLLMQEMWVQSLAWDDSTRLGATKPREPQLLSLGSRAWESQLLKPKTLEPVLHNKKSYCSEKAVHQPWRVAPAHRN